MTNSKNIIVKKTYFWSLITIFIVFFVYIYQDINVGLYKKPEKIIQWDVISYYAYLPATFIYNDYSLQSIDKNHEAFKHFWVHTLPNGNKLIITSMGLSIMYAPFFFIAHLLAEPLGFAPDGYSAPYGCALLFGCLVYLLGAFLLLRKFLSRYYSDNVIAVTLLIIGLATNLQWYATMEASMSHAFNFSLFSLFLCLTQKWYDKQNWITTIGLGLTMGLITLVRPTNILVIIIFILFGIVSWKNIKERILLFWKNNTKLLCMVFCAFLIWIPQFLYWKSITGQFLFYSYGEDERFFFNNPHIWQFLFSFRKGWFLYTPSMLISIAGFYPLWKHNRIFFFPLLLFLIPTIYVLSSWWCWWFGGSFGQRSMIDSYAFLSIPLAAFLAWISHFKLKVKIPLYLLMFLICALSTFHNVRYKYGSIHYDAMTKEAYFHGFFRLHVGQDAKYSSLLESPDYKAAREGRDAVLPPNSPK